MTYMVRERPDGQVEIVLSKPILVGIFPQREVANRVCSFLQSEEVFGPEEEPAGAADVADQVLDLVEEAIADAAGEAQLREMIERSRPAILPPSDMQRVAVPPPAPVRNLPAVAPEKPVAPAFLTVPIVPEFTEERKAAAFRRIENGEKIAVIAPDFGLTMGQLRSHWAMHKRILQQHIREGGQIACSLCKKPFTPSISHPDTCARCSHE